MRLAGQAQAEIVKALLLGAGLIVAVIVSGGTLIADRPRSFANDYGNAIDNFFANGFAG